MKLKTLVVAIVILAAISAVVYWTNRPAAAAAVDPRVGQPLVTAAAVGQAAKLRLSEGGKTVVLTRQSDGTWLDVSYFDFPADFSKLSGFVNDLTSAKLQRLVTTSPARLARLKFKDSKIDLLDASDHPLWTVTLGKTAEAGGRFVRLGDEPKAYLANLNAWLDVDPKNWADATLLSLKPEEVAKIEVCFDVGAPVKAAGAKPNSILENLDQMKKFGEAALHENVAVSRAKKDDPWTAGNPRPGQRVNAEKISSLLTSLGGLRFSDTSDPADPQAAAAKAHARTFSLTTFAGATYTLSIGRKPEEKKLKPAAKPAPAAANAAGTTPAAVAAGAPGPAKSAEVSKTPPAPVKPAEPEYDTIPAGPVFVWVTSSDAKAPVNALMKKRAFQIDEYAFTSLPQKPDELFEPAPASAPEKKPAAK